MNRSLRSRRWLALAAGLILLGSPTGGLGQGPAMPGEGAAGESGFSGERALEEVFLEFRVGSLAGITVSALTDGDLALLPATAIFQFSGLQYGLDESGTVYAILQPGSQRILILPDLGKAVLNGEELPVEDGWIVPTDAGEVYVAHPLLEQLLGVTIRMDWTELAAVVLEPLALPVGRRMAQSRSEGGPIGQSPTGGRSVAPSSPVTDQRTANSILEAPQVTRLAAAPLEPAVMIDEAPVVARPVEREETPVALPEEVLEDAPAISETDEGEGAIASFLDAGFMETLFEFRVGRVTRYTISAFFDGEVALLPATAVFEIAEMEYGFDDTGVMYAVLHPGPRRIQIRPREALAILDGEPVAARDNWVIPYGRGEVFVAHPVLEELLGVEIRVDWVELTAEVTDPALLPVGRRLAREKRWQSFEARTTQAAAVPHLDLDSAPLGGAVLDWGVSSDLENPVQSGSYEVGLGARVLGGSLRVSARSLGPAFESRSRVDATYLYVFQDRDWIQQIRVGDGFTTGPRLRDFRGFSMTNAPYLRGSLFGTDSFTGRVGPGWDVELRQSGQVVDLTRADEQGAFALDIPVRYGENAIQVVAFGPHGEVVTSERVLLMGRNRLPRGRLEWGLSGGECRNALCTATGNLDLHYGLTNNWTVRAGAEGFLRDTLSSYVQPYVAVEGLVAQSLELAFEGLHDGFARGAATFTPASWLRVRGAHTVFSGEIEEPVLHDGERLNTTEADLFFRPVRSRSRLYMRGALIRQSLRSGVVTRYQGSLSVPFGTMGLETGLRHETNQPEGGIGGSRNYQFATLTGLAPFMRRRGLWVRGEVEFMDLATLERVRTQVSHEVTPGVRLDLGAGWQKVAGGHLTVGINATLPQLRNITQMVANEGSTARVTQYSRGSVFWNGATDQVEFAPGPALERGGIAGFVFVDENGNGIMESGEDVLPGVRVVVGGRAVRSDVHGRYNAWDLVPFLPVKIWADSTSIEDPTLVPLRSAVSVTVPPSSFGRLDIAVTPSREISGRVVRVASEGEGQGEVHVAVPYAQLELVDLEAGTVRKLTAYSDGEFYEAGIRPGTYALRLDEAYGEQVGLFLQSGSLPVQVRAGRSLDVVGPLVLREVPSVLGDDSERPQDPPDSSGRNR